ncbi:phosphodiester glycosidase family protein [Streptomyces sp. AcE210]|uniref:phosphodiester glycosidase family protein n=1 Tax=Streptomyces sp. AcE210 TaxID=2292703 RepID=UPI000E3040E8|nr:phosphodiester glycosidase family protein [Streptomyces sp. AcE210]RFC71731.1 phosphodiester glycosidase family protein [Streptomyces sp. AcE210]
MPLGPDDLVTQAGEVRTLAAGVTYQTYTQGTASGRWTVWAQRNGTETFGSKTAAEAFAAQLADEGFSGTVDTFTAPASSDASGGVFGYGVRVGSFAPDLKASADRLAGWLGTAGFGARVIYTALDGNPSTGPWKVHVVRAAPTAAVSFKAVHGTDVATAATVRSMATESGAIAAVNGNEFDIHTLPGFSGYEGVPQGLYVQNNVLLGAANNGRTSLLLEGAGARVRVAEVTSTVQVTAPNGDVRTLDGVNRVPGRVLGCGGVGGDRVDMNGTWTQTDRPWRNQLCLDDSEIVIFRPEWGSSTPGPFKDVTNSVDVVMNGNWVVQEIRSPAGGPVPAGGRVLQGVGEGADWLTEHAWVGSAFKPGAAVKDADGASVTSPTLSAVAGGGPALVRDGEVFLNTKANGMTNFAYGPNSTLVQRHPRTMAGVTASGELLLVTVDGRDPGTSVGVTWPEAAEVMKWLGATDAVGLGSGGDATMVVDGTLANSPKDDWGTSTVERKVSSAVVIVPKS